MRITALTPEEREWIALAAKACGVAIVWHTGTPCIPNSGGPNGPVIWNPLDDDGNAFRLQVAVGMIVNAPTDVAAHAGVPAKVQFFDIVIEEPCTGWSEEARRAATRRAVVRCAAEHGRSLS